MGCFVPPPPISSVLMQQPATLDTRLMRASAMTSPSSHSKVAERERALLHQIEALKFQHRESLGVGSGGGGNFIPMSGFGSALVDNVVSSNGTVRRKGSGIGERGKVSSFSGGTYRLEQAKL